MPVTGNSVRVREAVRAILISPMAEVLLMRIRPPGRDDCIWITPGGGIESGETVDGCLRRELEEELGLLRFDVGPLVWLRQHTFDWGGQRIRQSERYYIVQADRFEPKMSDAVEALVLQQFRWWSLRELTNAEERLTPLSLATIVSEYLLRCPPNGPLEMEVTED